MTNFGKILFLQKRLAEILHQQQKRSINFYIGEGSKKIWYGKQFLYLPFPDEKCVFS